MLVFLASFPPSVGVKPVHGRIRMLQNQPLQTIPKAELLACSERHVWNLIARGDLPAYRPTGSEPLPACG